ncbi:MAG TPA: cytochrome c maturation protein CcmE [Ignavibacteriaceae bacterium]|nr:cytochrome c maturation protein CcmE [Ignavibacteriaceae bacterium]
MKSKYLFGGAIIVVFLGLMAYLFTQSNIQYESNFQKVMTKDRTVKATGSWVKDKNYEINKEKRTFSFYLQDENGTEMKVIYNGTIPNNFESARSVVVTGKYENGYFHAKDILTKCPSKYEGENVKTSSL